MMLDSLCEIGSSPFPAGFPAVFCQNLAARGTVLAPDRSQSIWSVPRRMLDASLHSKEIGFRRREFVLSLPNRKKGVSGTQGPASSNGGQDEPGWAQGLRELYNS